MKYLALAAASSLLSAVAAFVPHRQAFRTPSLLRADTAEQTIFDQEAYIAESKEMRLKHLEEQAMFALKIACENYGKSKQNTPLLLLPGECKNSRYQQFF